MKRKDLFNSYDTIFFDLDDTLYPEINYLRIAYSYISGQICNLENLDNSYSEKIYNFLCNVFLEEGRKELFQKLILKFNLQRISIEELINCLHTAPIAENSINIFPQLEKIICNLSNHKNLFILTNGNPLQQMNKFYALNIPQKNQFKIVLASGLGKEFEKPSPFFPAKIIKDYYLEKHKVVFVGDSIIDQQTALNAKINFINVVEILDKVEMI